MQLKNYLPSFILNKDLIKVLESQQIELDKLNLDLDDLKKQCFVSTATWGLKYWEEFVGINTNTNNSIEERRARVLAKLQGTGTTTVEIIKQITKSYFNTDKIYVTENTNNYEFTISVVWNKDSKFLDLENSVNEVKPAHLNFKFAIEKENFLKLETRFKKYEFYNNMCGTFNCGTIPDYSSKGVTIQENININSCNNNWPQKYKLCGGVEI